MTTKFHRYGTVRVKSHWPRMSVSVRPLRPVVTGQKIGCLHSALCPCVRVGFSRDGRGFPAVQKAVPRYTQVANARDPICLRPEGFCSAKVLTCVHRFV